MNYAIAAVAIVSGVAALLFLVEAATGRRIGGKRRDQSTAAATCLILFSLSLGPAAQLARVHPAPSLLLTVLSLACLVAGVAVYVWQGWHGRRQPKDH